MDALTLSVDLYELTMAASFWEQRIDSYATFDLFIRRLPKNRSYFIAAGLQAALDYLWNFSFDGQSIAYLKSKKLFKDEFLEYLKTLRFTGGVWALPEGTIFFPGEPVLRVSAPIIEAQLVESYLLNTVNISVTIAAKAARVVSASCGRGVYDFSLRRTQGSGAGLIAARSSYIAGCRGSSNVLAGLRYGIPVVGTMAHSFVMSFKSEIDSFRAYASTFPDNTTLLVDTYDYKTGIENAIKAARELETKGHRLKAIRLDSGDLVKISKLARSLLDKAGLDYVEIFASGNLDEFKIERLVKKNAPIDNFGVGTNMGVSSDAPYSDVIYKLSEIIDKDAVAQPVMKLSQDKVTYPGRKQILRITDKRGLFLKDILALESERIEGKPLLVEVMKAGELVRKGPSLEEIRNSAINNLKLLPHRYKNLVTKQAYPVILSAGLKKMIADLKKELKARIKQ